MEKLLNMQQGQAVNHTGILSPLMLIKLLASCDLFTYLHTSSSFKAKLLYMWDCVFGP